MVGVAQLVERRVVAPAVAGSSPVSHPTLIGGSGGTGRRAGLRIQCPQWRVGSTPTSRTTQRAGVAQLVERNLAKVEVAGSSPVARSIKAA